MTRVCASCNFMFKWLQQEGYQIRSKRCLLTLSQQPFNQQKQKMSSSTGSGHLERTSDKSRQEVISSAKVLEIQNISPTVKQLQLQVKDPLFSFKAGQWLDMFIPGVDIVGGYSMCSAPGLLESTRQLTLAVKYATHPPAHWIHTKCTAGDEVLIRAGGDFYYDPPQESCDDDLLLLAGGVGINPLYSILLHFIEINQSQKQGNSDKSGHQPRASLMFSARGIDELIFKETLREMSAKYEFFDLSLRCTREPVLNMDLISDGRIQAKCVASACAQLKQRQTKVFICGPGPFIKAMVSHCLMANIDKSRIFYESWW